KDRGVAAPVPARRAVDDHATGDRCGWRGNAQDETVAIERDDGLRREELGPTGLAATKLIALEQVELDHHLAGLVVHLQLLVVTQWLGSWQHDEARVQAAARRQCSGERQHVASTNFRMVEPAEVDGCPAARPGSLNGAVVLLQATDAAVAAG